MREREDPWTKAMDDAVAAIDKLRAENARLRKALEKIANTQPMYGGVPSYFMRIAREALEADDA